MALREEQAQDYDRDLSWTGLAFWSKNDRDFGLLDGLEVTQGVCAKNNRLGNSLAKVRHPKCGENNRLDNIGAISPEPPESAPIWVQRDQRATLEETVKLAEELVDADFPRKELPMFQGLDSGKKVGKLTTPKRVPSRGEQRGTATGPAAFSTTLSQSS